MSERIDLSEADELRDVVHRAVACLARGGVVALSGDSGYDLIASALDVTAINRINRWVNEAQQVHFLLPTLMLRGSIDLDDWADPGPIRNAKLASRAWPGPVIFKCRPIPSGLSLRLPPAVQSAIITDGWIEFESPAEWLKREILRLISGPLIRFGAVFSGAGSGSHGTIGSNAVDSLTWPEMIIDLGPAAQSGPPTAVTLDQQGWTIARVGSTPASQIEQWAGTMILFVCTGNTCRSPIAAALCKVVLARRLGCTIEDLASHGYSVVSAGVATSDGMAAATHALEVVSARGGSLSDHQSQRLSEAMIRHADLILAMTWDHHDAVLDQDPDAEPRLRLLDPAGEDIPDPVGMDLQTYQETAREIERHLEHLLVELGL